MEFRKVLADYASNLFDEIYPVEGDLQSDQDMKSLYEFLVERMPGIPPEFSIANLKLVWGEILFRVRITYP